MQDIKTARERFVMSECKNHYENIPAVSASAGLTLEYNDPIGHFIDLYARKSDLNFCTFKLTLKRFYLNHMIVNFFQNQPSFYRFIILTFIRNVFEI